MAATPAAFIDDAIRTTGLDDFGSPHFETYLEAWCADLADDRLSQRGRDMLARQAKRNLELRLRIEETLRREPAIDAVPIPPIVRIMGFPRSGTTLLHNLMALHPCARPLLRWELVAPLPPPDASTIGSDPRIEKVQRSIDALRGTELERMHWVEATDPEECTWGFADLSGLMGRGCIAAMPRWAEVLFDRGQPHRETYVEYRRLIQLLLWRNPMPPDGILVLKCPMDVGHLSTFLDVFPEAQVVLCHRDPYRTVTSGYKMQEVVSGPVMAQPETLSGHHRASGTDLVPTFATFADAMVEAAAAFSGRVTSVSYARLMAQPERVTLEAFGASSIRAQPEAITAAVRKFIAAQHGGRRAEPPASYPTYGLTPHDVRGDPSMARYIETFNVEPEDRRIAAPTPTPTPTGASDSA